MVYYSARPYSLKKAHSDNACLHPYIHHSRTARFADFVAESVRVCALACHEHAPFNAHRIMTAAYAVLFSFFKVKEHDFSTKSTKKLVHIKKYSTN